MSRRNELITRLLSGLTDTEFENLVRVREEARHIPDPRRKREARSIPTPRRPVPTPRKMGVKQLSRYFENNPIPPYRPVPISSMNIILIYICYWPAGKSVLGETVPQVLSTARGRTQTEGTVSPNTDRPRPVNNIFVFSHWDLKVSGKFYCSLQPMCVEEGRVRAAIQSAWSIANQNKTLQHDF